MTGLVNGVSINGVTLPNWVVRAVAAAAAAATVVGSEPIRTTYAAAYGDAVVAVSLTQQHTLQARAFGASSAVFRVDPTLRFAGVSNATATSTGNGAVRRNVPASAGADATCTAIAMTAQAIGEAQSYAVATAPLAMPHVVHPGRSATLCDAAGGAVGDVTRYATAAHSSGRADNCWAEASVKRSGNSYFDHDGFSVEDSTASAGVANALTTLVVTKPAYAEAKCIGRSEAFVIYPAKGAGFGSGAGVTQSAQSVRSQYGESLAVGGVIASVDGTLVKMASADASSGGVQHILRPAVSQAAGAMGSMATSAATSIGVQRTAFAGSTARIGAAYLVSCAFGTQYFADAVTATSSAGEAGALQGFAAHARANALSGALLAPVGNQHFAGSENVGVSIYWAPTYLINYAASASGTGVSSLLRSTTGAQHFAESSSVTAAAAVAAAPLINYAAKTANVGVSSLVASTTGTQHFAASVNEAATTATAVANQLLMADTASLNGAPIAVALVGRAYAVANSDTLAPEGRYMTVVRESRAMVVFTEERSMVVTA